MRRLPSPASLLAFFLAASAVQASEATAPQVPQILSLQEQANVRNEWLTKRLDTIVPGLMRREGIDLWLVIAREYNEDPVVETMLPATWLAARRRTILMFHDRGDEKGVERLAVSRYPVGDNFTAAWSPEDEPDQWKRLAELIAERDPERIGVNRSSVFPLADGLSATEEEALVDALGARYSARLVSAERLAIGWLETRIPEELRVYPHIVRTAHAVIDEGFSEQVITPGITRTADVEWWLRERVRGLGLETWFHPSVSIARAGAQEKPMTEQFAGADAVSTILPGDLLHVDFGITYLGLNTDTQHHAYVLRPGESDAPAGLRAGLADANRLQEIVMAHFQSGITGNELLVRAREEAVAAGLDPTIYSHAIGFHGHGAGPWIGMWDDQFAQPAQGEYPIHPNTAWSIELNVQKAVPEWSDKLVRFKAEEDAWFDGETIRFLDGRQTRLHLIPRQ